MNSTILQNDYLKYPKIIVLVNNNILIIFRGSLHNFGVSNYPQTERDKLPLSIYL